MEKLLKNYVIRIQGLADKEHSFEFNIEDKFFDAFEQDLVDNGKFDVTVKLIKSATMLQLTIFIEGSVRLICDRSLDEFDFEMNLEEPYLYKFGDRYEVMSDDIEVVPVGISEINIAQHLFDFIALSMPMKRLHPRYERDSPLNFREDTDEKEQNINTEIDPRWAALAALNAPKTK